ncbi:MAG: hypothetical protein OXC37_01235 [Bdellovibrionaceae bacterium]|nr:hypothetical protein [Pseudobdellovibrionaceae bacterium]
MFRKLFIIFIFITFSSCHLISKIELPENEQGNRTLANSNSAPVINTKEEIQDIFSKYFALSCIYKEGEPLLTQSQAMKISACYLSDVFYKFEEEIRSESSNDPDPDPDSDNYKQSMIRRMIDNKVITECSEDNRGISCGDNFFELAKELRRCSYSNNICLLIKESGAYKYSGYNYFNIVIVFPFNPLSYNTSKIDINIKVGGYSKAYYPDYLSDWLSKQVKCETDSYNHNSCHIVGTYK